MGWGFQKSFGKGLFRVTVSKSGISTSVGTKHGRITRSKRGTRVSSVLGPIRYTKSLGKSGCMVYLVVGLGVAFAAVFVAGRWVVG
jgi:hypothetical protein